MHELEIWCDRRSWYGFRRQGRASSFSTICPFPRESLQGQRHRPSARDLDRRHEPHVVVDVWERKDRLCVCLTTLVTLATMRLSLSLGLFLWLVAMVVAQEDDDHRQRLHLRRKAEKASDEDVAFIDPNKQRAEEDSTQGEDVDGKKRPWGASAGSNEEEVAGQQGSSGSESHRDDSEESNIAKKAAFVAKSKPNAQSSPPEAFIITARVYIDPSDKLAHFDDETLQIPYWDCGYTGSTTSPLPLKDAYFRHALTGATSWTGTDGRHAVLVVALSPLAMDLNSGESHNFSAGSVILLEDVLLPGHKMRPLQNSGQGVQVLFLTLPQQHTHTGKKHISLPPSFLAHRVDPCPNQHPNDAWSESSADGSLVDSSVSPPPKLSIKPRFSWSPHYVRRVVLGLLGLSMSTLAADFLGKTAPLWLAVGVGGTCFVAAGTWVVTVGGDALLTALEVWRERRRLGGGDTMDDEEEIDGAET